MIKLDHRSSVVGGYYYTRSSTFLLRLFNWIRVLLYVVTETQAASGPAVHLAYIMRSAVED